MKDKLKLRHIYAAARDNAHNIPLNKGDLIRIETISEDFNGQKYYLCSIVWGASWHAYKHITNWMIRPADLEEVEITPLLAAILDIAP